MNHTVAGDTGVIITSAGVMRSDLFSRIRSERASWLITRVAAPPAALESLDCPPPSSAGVRFVSPLSSSVGGGGTSVGSNRGESHRHTTASRRTCSWTKESAKKVCHTTQTNKYKGCDCTCLWYCELRNIGWLLSFARSEYQG